MSNQPLEFFYRCANDSDSAVLERTEWFVGLRIIGSYVDYLLALVGAHRYSCPPPAVVKACSRPVSIHEKVVGNMVELQDPRSLTLEGATQQLLAQVSSSVESFEQYRPLEPEIGERLRVALLPDRIVASLNMEGIVATRRQTLSVMDALRVSESVGRGEIEIANALRADEFITDLVEKGVYVSEQVVRETNRILLDGVRKDAGEYRQGPVELPGAPFDPPEPHDVPMFVQELTDLFPHGDALHPIVQAAWIHAQFTLVHPFSDGNGRTGRLLQDYTLLRRGYLPVGIPTSERDNYYEALEKADQGDWNAIVDLLADLELKILAKAEAVVQEPQKRQDWIQRLSHAAAQKERETKHKQYLVWRQRLERIGNMFGQAAKELDAESTAIGATVRDYGIVDFQDWQRICRYGYIDRSWLFNILFFAEGQPFYKTIGYLQRHSPRPYDPFSPPRDCVALYFTGVSTDSETKPDFHGGYDDPHIRLREILYVEDKLFAAYQDDPEADWRYEDLPSEEVVVEHLFMDVFTRKAGVPL